MKRLRYLCASVALCSLIGASSTFAIADSNNVTVVNSTPYTLTAFYASSSDAAGWDMTNNLIAGQSVGPGGQTVIPIDRGNGCQVDLMGILDGASQAAYDYQVNACDNGNWTITP
jgi:hypothetical protein